MSRKDRNIGYLAMICTAIGAYTPLIICATLTELQLTRIMPTPEQIGGYLTFLSIFTFGSTIWCWKVIEIGASLCTKKPERSPERIELEKRLWKSK